MHDHAKKRIKDIDGGVVPVKQFYEDATLEQIEDEYTEALGIFPALHKYKTDHNALNLQKLCTEISEFCRAIYASTNNEEERMIYHKMLDKLIKA